MAQQDPVDLAVIGGGINGTGIARDAAGRGLSVLLCEKDDLAGHTSSASTKLIHGGLRYLEYYEFRLVREALRERERLLTIAPHVIWPLRFVLPHNRALRPAWMIRAGLFLYDHLGGRKTLPASKTVDLRSHPAGQPLQDTLRRGFIYSDCWVQDSRLVVLNAMDAQARSARIMTRTACTSARIVDGIWQLTLRSPEQGISVRAKALVNAAGPWAASLFGRVVDRPPSSGIRLVKGSHIVVRRLFEHNDAYIFQQNDRRIVFAIPYERDFTLIGTTDVDHHGKPENVEITRDEIDYLCNAVNRYFARPIDAGDIVWSYSGVRPLYDDHADNASAATRDYVLDLDADNSRPPLLTVFGGKLTTYRRLAEHAMEQLQPWMGSTASRWTADVSLPGGDLPEVDFERFLANEQHARPWLPAALCRRLARNYGTRMRWILEGAQCLEDLGACFGADLYAVEVDYLVKHEWARNAHDIIWRRSKLGLQLSLPQVEHLQRCLQDTIGEESRRISTRN